ncbi:hypothetical protein EON63_00610 [archaeon]|nr:MAG: hypothetical protein EON63_00610 [archaeon]
MAMSYRKVDYDFSKAGYKTLGVVVKINDGPFVFCGILPMLDPPRYELCMNVSMYIPYTSHVPLPSVDMTLPRPSRT